MEEAAKIFTQENPNITVEVVACPQGTSPFEKVSALYASNAAPSISILDGGDIPKFLEKAVDLTGEKWVKDTPFVADCTIDGKVICFPVVVEGCGLIYNKAVLTKAGVDPTAITTQKGLEDALKKVQDSGVSGCIIGGMDWSLGNHLSVVAWANKSKNADEVKKFLDDIKAGIVDVAADSDFNKLVSSFDILKTYNKAKADPLSIDSNKAAEIISKGEAGFLFQGNWTWPEMANFNADLENFGMIALPISNDSADIANTGIQAGPTKFAIIDKEQNSSNQQAAAKKFLEWLVYSKSGNEAIVIKANCIMAFKNVELLPTDPLGKSIAAAIKNDKTLVFTGNLCPSDHWKSVGAEWQKYLADKSDKAALAKGITDYWKSSE
jgi:raffinose/stachyose/melibiose transport system substrate-binding protein